jgi:hypothetical protein
MASFAKDCCLGIGNRFPERRVSQAQIIGSVRPEVAFCVWSICRDGLRVAPFDGHTDGDATLRAAGMDGAAWVRWLRAVIGAQERLADVVACGLDKVDRTALRRAGRAAAAPIRFAPPRTRPLLRQWWGEYRDDGRSWRGWMRSGLMLDERHGRRLRAALPSNIGRVTIYLVPYPVGVAAWIEAGVVVIGLRHGETDVTDQVCAALEGVRSLRPDDGRRCR